MRSRAHWPADGLIRKLMCAAPAAGPTPTLHSRNACLAYLACVLPRATPACHLVQFFRKAMGVRVPRSRFLPVKCTSDLLAIQSNLFDIKHGS